MKIKVLNTEGKEIKTIDLPSFFDLRVREDIVQKVVEAKKIKFPYSPSLEAGIRARSIRHRRRRFKSVTGYGISRIGRKIMWRRGSRFYWKAAGVSGVVGGRKAHPPKFESMLARKKINKKEEKLALRISLASTAIPELLEKRYKSLEKISANLPVVVSSDILKLKTKEFFVGLKKILGNLYSVARQKKSIRAGKGKRRGRKYKKTSGLLFITGNNESISRKGIEIKKARNVSVSDLYPLGRLVVYTEEAIKDLRERK